MGLLSLPSLTSPSLAMNASSGARSDAVTSFSTGDLVLGGGRGESSFYKYIALFGAAYFMWSMFGGRKNKVRRKKK